MKHIIFFVLLICNTLSAFSQKFDTIFVNEKLSVYISLKDSPKLLDLGSMDYISNVKGDVILLKAKFAGVAPSSFLIQVDNDIKTGIIAYKKDLKVIHLDFRKGFSYANNENIQTPKTSSEVKKNNQDSLLNVSVRVLSDENDDTEINANMLKVKQTAESIKNYTDQLEKHAVQRDMILFRVTDLVSDEKFMYIKVSVTNKSNLSYKFDYVSFELSGKEKRVLNPIYTTDNEKLIKSKETANIVYVMPLYAGNNRTTLEVIFREDKGLRKAYIKIPYNYVMRNTRVIQ